MDDASAQDAPADVLHCVVTALAGQDRLPPHPSGSDGLGSSVSSSTPDLSQSIKSRHAVLPSLTSVSLLPSHFPATTMALLFNNRLVTSNATAQALAAAMTPEAQRAPGTRTQRLTRRHSASEDTSQMSSREESSSVRVLGQASRSSTSREFDSFSKRSLDAEEGIQQLQAKAKSLLRDKIKANRVGVKRMSLASGATPASLFTAAVLAVTASSSSVDDSDVLAEQDHDSAQGEQYEQMMERFQIRRLQRSLSNISSTDAQSEGAVGAKSSRVIPIPVRNDVEECKEVAQGVDTVVAPSDNTEASSAKSSPAAVSAAPIAQFKHALATTFDPATVRLPPNLPTERGRALQTYRDTYGAYSMADALTARGPGGDGRLRGRSRMRRIRRRLVYCLSTPLSPYSWVFAVRSAIMLASCGVDIVYSPYHIAFFGSPTAEYITMSAILDAIFLVDFALTFNTSVIDKRGSLVTSRTEIAYRYVSTWGIPQFVACIPLTSILHATAREDDAQNSWVHYVHMIYDCPIRMQQVVQILQLFHRVGKLYVGRSSKSIWGWLLYSRYSHLVRLTWLLVAILLIAHYLACAWKMLQPTRYAEGHAAFEVYTGCFYGAMQLLEGQGLSTETLAQNVFSSIAVLLGSVVLAIIYGHVTMLVSNFNANATGYQRKMEVVFAMMEKMQLPASLRERVHQYYQHLWREYESLDGEVVKFSKDLTHNLALEVSLFKYMDLTMHVPFWRLCSPDFQKQLVLSLQVRVYLPDDFVLRRGEVSDEFYMINRGVCEIVRGKDSFEHCTAALRSRQRKSTGLQAIQPTTTPWETPNTGQRSNLRRNSDVAAMAVDMTNRTPQVDISQSVNPVSSPPAMIDDSRRYSQLVPGTDAISTRLSRGQAFGEAALLFNYPRTANARAVTYVEMCILDRKSFQDILARHPADRRHVMAQMLAWLMNNNEFHRVTCPLKHLVREVFDESNPDEVFDMRAASAAGFMAEALDNHVEGDTAEIFGTGLEQQLVHLQAKEFAAPSHYATTRAPLCYFDASHASRCACACCSTYGLAGSKQGSETKTELGGVMVLPVALTAEPHPFFESRAERERETLLDFSLDNTDQSQAWSFQLLGKLRGGVEANMSTKTASTSASLPSVAKEPASASQRPSVAAYGSRRLSITRKRSMSSPVRVGQTDDEFPAFPGSPALGIDLPISNSSYVSALPDPRTLRPRQDSVGSKSGPLLRRMTSFMGLSKSGAAAATANESPTRLADQLFQQHDPGSPVRTMMQLVTFNTLSLMRPND